MARSSSSRSADRNAVDLASPIRIGRLLGEIRWFLLLAASLTLACALFTYHKADPGWSHSAQVAGVANFAGKAGAWAADLLLYVFGASAVWLVVLMFYRVVIGWRVLHTVPGIETPPAGFSPLAWVGFLLVFLSSCSLESIRMHSVKMPLPGAPGGVIGALLGDPLQGALGFTGGTLLLLLVFVIGLSLFFHFSWLAVAECLGGLIEDSVAAFRDRCERRQDELAGELAAAGREEFVEERRVRIEELPPVQIVRAQAVERHECVEKEKQKPLLTDIPDSALPQLSLLDPPPPEQQTVSAEALEFTSRLIEKKLRDFGIEVQMVAAYPGPVVTRYEIEPATGVKGRQIVNLAKDLARSLSLVSIRVVETIPGKTTMGLELPNPQRQSVRLSEILGSAAYNESQSVLTLALGKDIAGKPTVADLARMPHCLVAGTTGSGKSVGINAMILSMLYKATPDQVRLIMIDPKMLELSIYEGIPHLLCPVVTDMRQAGAALNWAVAEMERRYKLMSKLGVRNLAGFNKKVDEAEEKGEHIPNPFSLTPDAPEPLHKFPMVVVVIDELADLMMVVGKKVEELIARIAQKARAAGIHLILATQRPSVDVITGLIKANIPTRIAFQVSSKIDSRTILDQMGAEALLGMGDMLFLAPGTGLPQRVHGAFVSDEEVHHVVEKLKEMGPANYIEGLLETSEEGEGGTGGDGEGGGEADPLYDQAVEVVIKNRRASISLVQRHLRIGYNRAARLLEDMEKAGLVSAMSGSGNREILTPNPGE
ncbi:MAG: DNA translocase FtsK 4TM domain-containing protein [Candidatus Protistobacter heckmanni]|nr:DNA translocase FtsK 4TM domain-containing protein [Candidatus Protistobacter heckmanni]